MEGASTSNSHQTAHPGIVAIYLDSLNRDIRFFLKLLASSILYHAGGIWIYRTFRRIFGRRGKIVILAYHSVSDEENFLDLTVPVKLFEKHVLFLKKRYEIISLEEAVRLIKQKCELNKDYAVITFDDGYLDNYTNVFPIVKKHGVPITIFYAVQPIESKRPLTVDVLISTMRRRKSKCLKLPGFQLPEFPLSSKTLSEFAVRQINDFAKQLDGPRKQQLIDAVVESSGADGSQLDDSCLSWEQVREMAASGVGLGAHTLTHPKLSAIGDSQALSEIEESKRRIEERVGQEVKFFAYPYGGSRDFKDEHEQMVCSSRYEAACSLIHGDNDLESNIFRLRRINANWTFWKRLPGWSLPLFAAELAGIFQGLRVKR